jgi:hypothetical protein
MHFSAFLQDPIAQDWQVSLSVHVVQGAGQVKHSPSTLYIPSSHDSQYVPFVQVLHGDSQAEHFGFDTNDLSISTSSVSSYLPSGQLAKQVVISR